jgi:two-component system cell cycle response regulator
LADALHVLLVEDNAEYSAYIIDALSVSDGAFRTTPAASLRQAAVQLTERSFDMILLDLSLPDSSGLATLHRINALAGGTPIVVLSGLLDQELAVAAVQAGAQDYLVKSEIGAAVISRVIRYAIERRAADARLRERDAHYRSIVESSFDAVISMDGSGVTEFNAKAEEMFGRRRADVIGKDLTPLIVPERSRSAHREGVRRQLVNPDAAISNQRLELMGLRADGSEFPLELTLSKQSSRHSSAT